MPTITNATLNLTTVNDNVTADVTFNAVFTRFERNLADLGMTFDRHVDIIAVDGTSTTVLTSFDPTNLPVTAGAGSLTIPVSLSVTKPRSFFQEDTDNDEIGCNIRIHSQGFPPVFTPDFFTIQRVLVG
ncbi:MAG: hypothetical protein ABIT71_22595 [Vicinamibacteraceae bacterium]